jgi:hypothetical protein
MNDLCLNTDTLASYICGSIDQNQRQNIEKHLANCSECMDRFAMSIELLEDKELHKINLKDQSKSSDFLKHILQRASKIYDWCTNLPEPQWVMQPVPVMVRDETKCSYQAIRLKRSTNQLNIDIYIIHYAKKSFTLKVFLNEQRKAENCLSIVLFNSKGHIDAKPVMNNQVVFNEMGFGQYKMVIDQNTKNIGEYTFEINETGLIEGE